MHSEPGAAVAPGVVPVMRWNACEGTVGHGGGAGEFFLAPGIAAVLVHEGERGVAEQAQPAGLGRGLPPFQGQPQHLDDQRLRVLPGGECGQPSRGVPAEDTRSQVEHLE